MTEDQEPPADWKEAYQEASEDLRHYNATSWQIPSATLIVVFVIVGFAFSRDTVVHLSWQKGIVILLGSLFTFIVTWNFIKYVHRSGRRIKLLREIEGTYVVREARRFNESEPWYIQFPLDHVTSCLLALLGFALFILALKFLA